MKKIDSFTNLYPLSKTLRFSLIPQGMTETFFEERQMLEADEQRAGEYGKVKRMIDRYHKVFIDRVLEELRTQEMSTAEDAKHPLLDAVLAYAALYRRTDRTAKENDEMEKLTDAMRKQISAAFHADEQYKGLFGKEIIREYLPGFVSEEEREMVSHFYSFTTYFTGFYQNRENMYTGEGKATEIAFRIADQNLPRFLDNCRIGRSALAELPEETVKKLADTMGVKLHIGPSELFEDAFFLRVLSQSGIDDYNQMLGGCTGADGTKVQGLNEYINLYGQLTGKKMPKLKPLYKQILSDRSSLSFIPEQFENDDAVLRAVCAFWNTADEEDGVKASSACAKLTELLCGLGGYDRSGIYVPAGKAVTDLSQGMLGSWQAIQSQMEAGYDAANRPRVVRDEEKYAEKRKEYFKKIKSYSLETLQGYVPAGEEGSAADLTQYIAGRAYALAEGISAAYEAARELIENPYTANEKLIRNDPAIALIKAFLDAVMDFKHFADMFLGSGKEAAKNDDFYGEYAPLCEKLEGIIPLYNRVRNYMTQKPYSDEKIKLNFDNPQFLGGWDRNKESDYSCVMLLKDGQYYLAVMSKESKKAFEKTPEPQAGEAVYSKMVYKLLPGPNKMLPKVFFSKGRIAEFAPSPELVRRYKAGTYKQGPDFSLADCHELIDFFKASIEKHEDWSKFGFRFSDTSSYATIADFYKEVLDQGYSLKTVPVPVSYVDELVNTGAVYLFRLYNKDFSEYSKGTPNLHTLYFRMLFDERNLAEPVFKLNGEAEMFYRKASLKREETTVHEAGRPVKNKNPENPKAQSVFDYDIIKDRRYTKRQFTLHVPITLNMRAEKLNDINPLVRRALRECDDNYVIGIDRGERNLLYICVIDGSGRIVEQYSLNRIVNEYNGITHTVDYHRLLDAKEQARDAARKDWKSIETIKDLKEGYISQVVHKISELAVKYDAVIAMEDLNFGFKSGRSKVEKSVYQKFEKMLIDKLNFLADKKKSPDELGGLLNAYQLTNKFESFARMGKQNGFIFYIPAWMTSKIDPTTGFTDLLKPRFKSADDARGFINTLDFFRYDDAEGCYVFGVDYAKFPGGAADPRKKWDVYTRGERIRTFRNPAKNNEWDNEELCLTDAFAALFEKYGVATGTADMRGAMAAVKERDFFVHLMKLFSLTLQMRNSVTGTDIDYLVSPVKNARGGFYDSRDYAGANAALPSDADANGAYHIARKAQLAIERIRACDESEIDSVKLAVTNADWLAYVQKGTV